MILMMIICGAVNSVCRPGSECECFTGYALVLLSIVNVISAFTKCYPVNDQQYCFYADGSVLSWDEAREFCLSKNSTLPIITDEDIDNVFQLFISEINGSHTAQINSYVWLDARAVHNSSHQWHWINGQPSGSNMALLNKQETQLSQSDRAAG